MCDHALDRLPAHLVAAMAMDCRASAAFSSRRHRTASQCWSSPSFVGHGSGAKGGMIAYLVSRRFGLEIYGTVLGV